MAARWWHVVHPRQHPLLGCSCVAVWTSGIVQTALYADFFYYYALRQVLMPLPPLDLRALGSHAWLFSRQKLSPPRGYRV